MLSGPSFQTDKEIHQIVLFLHGYGANGQDLLNIANQWQNALPHTLFIAPNGPYEYSYASGSYMWFDFKDVNHITAEDMVNGLEQIRPAMEEYLQHLSSTYSVPISKIIPVGFSQGAMVALDLLTTQRDIKKAIGYSGIYYPTCTHIDNASIKSALLIHGTDDNLVSYAYMSKAEAALTKLGIPVTSITCSGLGHSINQQGIVAGETFLKEAL